MAPLPASHHVRSIGAVPPASAAAPVLARSRIEALLNAAPFLGRGRLKRLHVVSGPAPCGIVVCVPACDEAERLRASLDTIAVALDTMGEPALVVVAVNNSNDKTFDIACQWSEGQDHAALICDVGFDAAIADAGHARRLAFDLGAVFGRGDAVLLSTDADTRVAPNWAIRMVGKVRAGAGLVVGQIDADDTEFAAMPRTVREAEAAERRMLAAQDALWARLVPDVAQIIGLRAGGANLAVDARAYARIGGAPTPVSSEDRALVAAMAFADEPIATDRARTIETSCRLDARAANGMAGMLKARLADPDPLCDEVLMPARTFALRALAWRHLHRARRVWRTCGLLDDVEALANALPVAPSALFPRVRAPGRDWDRLQNALGMPGRLRVSDLARETRRAEVILGRLTPGAPVERQVAEISSC